MPPKNKKRRRGEVELTSKDELLDALNSAVSSEKSAELAVLHLFKSYDFNLDDLRRLLLEQDLNVSFSKVKYRDIAPRVGLDPNLAGKDMTTFEVFRARIPTSMFEAIVGDLDIIMNQYGDPTELDNEEARSKCLAPLLNRTVALFRLTIRNIPESTIPGCMATKGRVEYHFVLFGGLSLLVIEVKFELGTGEERANAVGQVIAECDACDYSNDCQNFSSSPIYGILCDGRTFEFFMFDGGTLPPTFSRGIYRNLGGLSLADFNTTTNDDYIDSLRPVCEVLFYFLLLTYRAGIRAYMERSIGDSINPRQSTSGWGEADKFAALSLSHAMNAAMVATTHDPAADGETKMLLTTCSKGLQFGALISDHRTYLKHSLEAIPAFYKKNRNLLFSWNRDRFNFS